MEHCASTSSTRHVATASNWNDLESIYTADVPEFRSQLLPESVADHDKEAWDLLAQGQVAVSRVFGTI